MPGPLLFANVPPICLASASTSRSPVEDGLPFPSGSPMPLSAIASSAMPACDVNATPMTPANPSGKA